jgi:predicted ArsR family transcriptional regulator
MEESILELLEQHGSLAYEQIAAHLNQAPDAVRNALTAMRERGLVDVLSVGELEAHGARAAAYWRLTDDGRAELARCAQAECRRLCAPTGPSRRVSACSMRALR